MSETMTWSFLPPLIERYYGLKVAGLPELLHERDGQRIFKVGLAQAEGAALTVRLCTEDRPHEKVLADTGALLFLSAADFLAPRLRLTVEGERVFQWQPACWGYATDFIAGENPFMDIPTLTDLGRLLGRLHRLAPGPGDYPVQVGWLDEMAESFRRTEAALNDPTWGQKAAEIAQNLHDLPLAELQALPFGLIHTDVHEGNMLRTPEGRLYLLDWEDAGQDKPVFDLALVLGWNCVWRHDSTLLKPDSPPELYDFDEEYCRTLLEAYQSERPLSDGEMAMLGPAVRWVMGWFAARDIEREIEEPGVSEGLAFTNWAIMRSVTPLWMHTLHRWAFEARLKA